MAATTIIVTYISTLPSTTSTVTLTIPTSSDYSATIQNLAKAGGVSFIDANGTPTWVTSNQILKITAQ